MNVDQFIEIEKEKLERKRLIRTFTFGKTNNFDKSIEEVLNKLLSEKLNLNKESQIYTENQTQETSSIEEIINALNIYRNEEELKSLIEMKIVHLYKFFEINTKQLLKLAYPKINEKDFYKWYSITNFIKINNINPKEIKCYNEVNTLREVNNSIKHSKNIESKLISKVLFIKKDGEVNFNHLISFYDKIKDAPIQFLNDLSEKIHNELYTFDEEKIDTIFNELVLRMDYKHIELLIKKLQIS